MRKNDGLTLLELLVTTAIGGALVTALLMILSTNQRAQSVADGRNHAVTESFVVNFGLETVFRQSLRGIPGFVLKSDSSLDLFRDNGTPNRSKYSLSTQCQPIPAAPARYALIAGKTFKPPADCTLTCPAGQQYVIREQRWQSWTADTDPSTIRIFPSGNRNDDPVGMAVCFNTPAALSTAIGGRITAYYLGATKELVSVEKPFLFVRNQTLAAVVGSIEVIP